VRHRLSRTLHHAKSIALRHTFKQQIYATKVRGLKSEVQKRKFRTR
jgi:hypothetical protein